VLGDVAGGGGVGAVLWIAAVEVLGPEAVEDEGGVLGTLGCGGVGVAVLGRPGEIEEVVVEVLRGGWEKGVWFGLSRLLDDIRGPRWGLLRRVTAQSKEQEDGRNRVVVHANVYPTCRTCRRPLMQVQSISGELDWEWAKSGLVRVPLACTSHREEGWQPQMGMWALNL
jgi:hypothetical protein